MRWLKDQKVETLLKKLNVKFEIEQVLYSKIDLEEGLRRQARLVGKINQDHAIQLALGMSDEEAAFPMVVLNKPKSGSPWPWSGNHRLAAVGLAFPDDCNKMVLDVYVTQVSDPVMQDILPRVLNVVESSLGFSKEERVQHARYLCAKHSISLQEAATMFNIKPEWISSSARAEEVREELLPDLGEKVNGMAKTTLLSLHTLADDKQVLKQAAKIVLENELPLDDVRQLIKDVKNQPSHLQKLSEIGRWDKMLNKKKEPKTSAAKVISQTTRTSFLSLLARLNKILDKAKTIEQVQCSDPSDMERVVQMWCKIERGMRAILNPNKENK